MLLGKNPRENPSTAEEVRMATETALRAALAMRVIVSIAMVTVVIALVTGCDPDASRTTPMTAVTPQPTSTPSGTRVALDQIDVTLSQVARGFDKPVFLTHAGDGSGRLFVVEQGGRIRVIRDGAVVRGEFLDISDLVSTGGERGLLGLAFSPDYLTSGRFYVNYTDRKGDTVVTRYTVADPASDSPALTGSLSVLKVPQPYGNHNGGCIIFGPDSMLWVGMGDGGSGGDPEGRAQDPDSLLGKMLRLDVSGNGRARPASDNPGPVGTSGLVPEAYQSGLRNPWRFSFDRENGDLWIGDVGQTAREEINHVELSSAAGANFGWNIWEATHPYPDGTNPSSRGFIFPVVEYGRGEGRSVTGGYVYRGSAYPELDGVYLYADYVDGWVAGLRLDASVGGDPDAVREERVLARNVGNPSSFGEDADGELYLVDHGGTVYRIEARLR